MREVTPIRTIKLENKAIQDALIRKRMLTEDGININKKQHQLKEEIEALDEEVKELIKMAQEEQDKVIGEVTKEMEGKLGQDENYSRIYLNEQDEIEVEIFNMYTEYKKWLESKPEPNEDGKDS